MDLSKLSSNLPLSEPPTEESINAINKELSEEFKSGARSIAALYRLSNSKNSLLLAKGYLNCLNDIQNLLENGNLLSMSDLKTFLKHKLNELSPNDQTNHMNKNSNGLSNDVSKTQIETESTENGPTSANLNQRLEQQLQINQPYDFQINNPTTHRFPPSRIPLSIERDLTSTRNQQRKKSNQRKNRDHFSTNHSSSSVSASSDEEVVLEDNDFIDNIDYNDVDFQNFDTSTKRKVIENSFNSKKIKH